ncbi:MAG: hypothetical protein KAW52_03190 [candidate division Zixibacteria bacterium]|nr:hypothetical protein [candidate division Zixibacteria bacterium]
MIDLHTHILPGVDDGAKTIEQSLFMVKQGEKAGIKTICATPHILHQVTPQLEEKIHRSFDLLKTKIAQGKDITSSSPFISLKYYLALGPDNELSMKVNVWGEVGKPRILRIQGYTDLLSSVSVAGDTLRMQIIKN